MLHCIVKPDYIVCYCVVQLYGYEKDGIATYARGCRSTDVMVADFRCSDYATGTCNEISSTKVCLRSPVFLQNKL